MVEKRLLGHGPTLMKWLARMWGALVIAGLPMCGLDLRSAEPELPTSSDAMSEHIDLLLASKLQELEWEAAGQCDDASFLRRAYLDLTGTPPSGREVLDFVSNKGQTKRAELVDRLLASPNSASFFAATWAGWMLPDENSGNPFVDRDSGLQNWLRDRFAENLRYDRLVSDLLVSTGPVQTGPTAFFVALEGKPEKIAAKTARVFMGVQLDCAECHDHPFDDWTQEDFWGYAAYFAQMSTASEQAMVGRGDVTDTNEGDVTLPETEQVIAPKPLVDTGFSGLGSGTRRQQLTLWLTARENPFLARATVNRVWAMLFGQGLIEPIDDMRSLDLASHPQLLSDLSDYFAATGYDLRVLVKTLANTKAYSRSSQHSGGQPPEASYATMATKPLTQLQMATSLAHVSRQISGPGSDALQAVLKQRLGKLRGDASAAELGIVSALVTLNGESVDNVSRENSSRLLVALDAPFMNGQKQLRWLFLSTLNRLPSAEESAAFSAVVNNSSESGSPPPVSDGPDGVSDDSETPASEAEPKWQSDLLWALLNSSEFAMTP